MVVFVWMELYIRLQFQGLNTILYAAAVQPLLVSLMLGLNIALKTFSFTVGQCSGLIYTDTSIGGKFTIREVLNDKATKKIRHQFQTGSCAHDPGTGTEYSACQPKHGNGLTAIRRWVTQI